jgi:hypothetical protein
VSCVDRQTPRAMLNRLAYRHLVPVIDLGTAFRVDATGSIVGDAGRVVVIGPGRPCPGVLGPPRPTRAAYRSALGCGTRQGGSRRVHRRRRRGAAKRRRLQRVRRWSRRDRATPPRNRLRRRRIAAAPPGVLVRRGYGSSQHRRCEPAMRNLRRGERVAATTGTTRACRKWVTI